MYLVYPQGCQSCFPHHRALGQTRVYQELLVFSVRFSSPARKLWARMAAPIPVMSCGSPAGYRSPPEHLAGSGRRDRAMPELSRERVLNRFCPGSCLLSSTSTERVLTPNNPALNTRLLLILLLSAVSQIPQE